MILWRSVVRAVLLVALVTLFTLTGVVLATAYTEFGTRAVVAAAERWLPIDLDQPTGTLARELCLGTVHYDDDLVSVSAQNVCVSMAWIKSIDALGVHIDSAAAHRVDVTLAQTPPSPPEDIAPIQLPGLPVTASLGALSVDLVNVGELAITNVSAQGVELVKGEWRIGALGANSTDLRLDTACSIRYPTQHNRTEVDATVRVNRGELLDLTLTGPPDALRVDAATRSPLPATLSGMIDVTRTNWPLSLLLNVDAVDLTPYGLAQSIEPSATITGDLRTTTADVIATSGDGTLRLGVARIGSDVTARADFAALPLRTDAAETAVTGSVDVVTNLDMRHFDARIDALSGLFTTAPLNGNIVIDLESGIHASRAALTAGAGTLEATGHWQAAENWRFEVLANEFAISAFGGSTRLDADLRGDHDTLRGTATAGDLRYADWSIDTAVLTADTGADTWLGIDAAGVRIAGRQPGALAVELTGSATAGGFTARADHPFADVALGGTFDTADRAVTVEALTADLAEATPGGRQTLTLLEPTTIRVVESGIDLSPVAIGNSLGGRADVMLSAPANSGHALITDWALPAQTLAATGVTVAADVQADVRVTDLGRRIASGTAALTDIEFAGLPAPVMNAISGPGEIAVEFTATAESQTIVATGTIPGALALDGSAIRTVIDDRIDGTADLELSQMAFLSQFLEPYVSALDGELAANTKLTGSLEQPAGAVTWTDGSIDVSALGLTLRGIEARVDAPDADTLTIQLDATDVAGAPIAVVGRVAGSFTGKPTGEITLSTAGARLVDRTDASGMITADLTYRLLAAEQHLEGSARIDDAEFVVATIPDTVVTASDDVVVEGRVAANPAQPLNADVSLTVGERVHLTAFGLDTGLTGNLDYVARPGQPVAVHGTLQTSGGTFAAYGQKLAIETGTLTFDGPMDDPLVTIVANRTVETDQGTYVVSLQVGGYPSDLDTEVTSNPPLSETDALSLLVTGRLYSQVGASEQGQVENAAIAMGLRSTRFVTDRIAERVGLDELTVSNGDNGIEVGVGRRINANLFLRYTYNALSRIGGILIDYDLSRRLRVRAAAGDVQSIEFQYIFR